MAINIFGNSRLRGPAGPPGKDAVEFYKWCPQAVVKMFRESEDCTYYFDTESDGVTEEGGKHALKDRNGKNHAICIQNYQKPVRLGKLAIYGLPLNNTKFKLSTKDQGLTPKSIFVVAFTFKLDTKLDNKAYYIFSNESGSRAVSITDKQLDIWGTVSPQLEYEKHGWNVMLLQYSRMTDAGNDKCFFILNGRVGQFEPKIYEDVETDIYIGGAPKQRTAPVTIASFEIYSKIYAEAVDDYLLPKYIYKPLEQFLEDRVGP